MCKQAACIRPNTSAVECLLSSRYKTVENVCKKLFFSISKFIANFSLKVSGGKVEVRTGTPKQGMENFGLIRGRLSEINSFNEGNCQGGVETICTPSACYGSLATQLILQHGLSYPVGGTVGICSIPFPLLVSMPLLSGKFEQVTKFVYGI